MSHEYQKNRLLFFLWIVISFPVFSAGSDSEDSPSSEKTVNVNYLNGKEKVANHDYQEAISYLLKAAESDSENVDVFNLLGYSQSKLEMNDKAFDYYERALTLDPRHRGAH